jgi:hypothetical protein
VTAFDQTGVDWLSEDGLLAARPCAPNIADHVILYSAFASQRPVIEAHIKLGWKSDRIRVENHDGITVGDVMDAIFEWSVDFPGSRHSSGSSWFGGAVLSES